MDETKPKKAPKEKLPKVATAKKVVDLTNYTGEVAQYELSKQLRQGALGSKYIILARLKPRSGSKNTTVWFTNEEGQITNLDPYKEYVSESAEDALAQIGYKLI